jgi:hypothetical protein
MSTSDSKDIANTPIGKLSDMYISEFLKNSPSTRTYESVGDQHDELEDYSYDTTKMEDLNQKFIQKVSKVRTNSEAEQLAKNIMLQTLNVDNQLSHSKQFFANWGPEDSPVTNTLALIEYSAKNIEPEQFLSRVSKVPTALTQWFNSLEMAKKEGILNSEKSASALLLLLEKMYKNQKYLGLVKSVFGKNLTRYQEQIARQADAAHYSLYLKLKHNYLPYANKEIGIGYENYQLLAKNNLGMEVNLREIYNQVKESLAVTLSDIKATAKLVDKNFYSVTQTMRDLDKATANCTHEQISTFVWDLQEKATKVLKNTLDFKGIKPCELLISTDPLDENPYYLPHFSKEQNGVFVFPEAVAKKLWRTPSTVYHESIPGHHLQFSIQNTNQRNLTSYQKMLGENPGFEEGWAFYVEKLLDKLGIFETPSHRLSHLLDKALRLSRVELDIAIHLRGEVSKIPQITYFEAINKLLTSYQSKISAVYEVDRYLALPAQAITYQIGSDVIEREIAKSSSLAIVSAHSKILAKGTRPLNLL